MKQNECIELEFTFLVKKLPNELKNLKPLHMLDVYFPDTEVHPKMRIRKKGEKYEITKKHPVDENDASIQIEHTITLSKKEFDALKNCSKKTIEKNRYLLELNGIKVELDVFLGKLKGLVLVDFEFNNIEERSKFKVPDIALADVTQELFIAGGVLAGKSYKDIEKDLQRFNYKKLTLD